MITTADTLEIMAVVAACHHRTAPRMDDEQAAVATATLWTELFEEFDFGKGELIAAVKSRAKMCPDAPEPADIIRVARSRRSDEMARTPIRPAHHDDEHYPGDSKAALDPAPYPAQWNAEQRVSAYWHATSLHAVPHTTAGWLAIAEQLEHKRAKRERGDA
jgi:hypothetical protein